MDILDELWKSRHEKDILFLELIDGYIIKADAKVFPDSIFYIKDDNILIQYDMKQKECLISRKFIWLHFENKFSIRDQKIEEIMKILLETHLKIKETRPICDFCINFDWLIRHIKLHGTTSQK